MTWKRATTAAIFFLIIIFFASWQSNTTIEVCSTDKHSHHEHCSFYNIALVPFLYARGTLQENGEAVIAFFTVVLAISTIGLWVTTKKLWQAGEEALIVSERAYVFLDGFDVELTTGEDTTPVPDEYVDISEIFITRFAVLPRWKNGGTTPTKNMTIQVNWAGPDITLPHDYVYRREAQPMFLAPQATQLGQVIEIPSARSLIDWAAFGQKGTKPMILIWGRADYQDIFNRVHFFEWCVEVRFSRHEKKSPLRATFIQWGNHNRSGTKDREAGTDSRRQT